MHQATSWQSFAFGNLLLLPPSITYFLWIFIFIALLRYHLHGIKFIQFLSLKFQD